MVCWKLRMSSISISALSILLPAFFDVGAVDALDVFLIEDGLHRLDGRERLLQFFELRRFQHAGVGRGFVGAYLRKCPSRRKPGRSSPASGTKSLIIGERLSVRLPNRIVASCVRDPTGAAMPRLIASTPAINVVETAPIPGINTPNLPSAGAILTFCSEDKPLNSLEVPLVAGDHSLDVGMLKIILTFYAQSRDCRGYFRRDLGNRRGRRKARVRRTLLSIERVSRRRGGGHGVERTRGRAADHGPGAGPGVSRRADARPGRHGRDPQIEGKRDPAAIFRDGDGL